MGGTIHFWLKQPPKDPHVALLLVLLVLLETMFHDDVELLEGTLLKKGGLFMGWREKHFILSSKTLKYYNPSSRATPKGCLALDSLKRCCADGSPSAHLWGISPYPPMDRSDPSATTKRPHGMRGEADQSQTGGQGPPHLARPSGRMGSEAPRPGSARPRASGAV